MLCAAVLVLSCQEENLVPEAVQEGYVSVNGEVCLMRGKKIRPGDTVSFDGEELEVVAGEGYPA